MINTTLYGQHIHSIINCLLTGENTLGGAMLWGTLQCKQKTSVLSCVLFQPLLTIMNTGARKNNLNKNIFKPFQMKNKTIVAWW